MPYVGKRNREVIDAFLSMHPASTTMDKMIACIQKFAEYRTESYAIYNDIMGALYGTVLEFNRRFEFDVSAPCIPNMKTIEDFTLCFSGFIADPENKEEQVFLCAGDLNYALSTIINDSLVKLSSVITKNLFEYTAKDIVENSIEILISTVYTMCGKYEDKKIAENGDVYTILGE